MASMIWIPSETEAWEPAQLISNDAKSVTVRLKGGKEVKIPGSLPKFDAIPPGAMEEECENLVNLENFSEGIILHHVKKRFAADEIYTFVGSILVAVNPYKPLNIYDLGLVDQIYSLTKFNSPVPPHVFSIGAAAVYNMRYDSKDQSVLISGESGAGKTEATKKILQFISTVCGSTASRIGGSIENQILDSNPLLESFGNAKTMRNNNSSRFGKYMEVNCDKKNNIKGCNVKAYLLEKSRVVKQGPMERNYHIFYMLLAGATKEMKKNFALKPADQFYYISQSGCTEVDRRSDSEEFEQMLFAMNSLAIDENLQNLIFQCLAGILHLGNLSFAPSRDIEGGSRATVPADCRRIATLFGINPDALERAMCTRHSTINGETTVIPLSPEKAVDQRDTLAKYVYGKIFDTIVARVNQSLYRGRPAHNIGVLDIFGFEVFQVNSFEQLCINYCNERLQTFFNEIIFEGEMKMYSAEGLPCEDISFQDNVGCVRLIDLRGNGIFAYLDEEIVMPKGSDEKFVSKLNQIFDENAATKSVYFARQRRNPMEFAVRHFAGDVVYNAKDFMEKNKDALAEALVEQMQQSSIPMLVTAAEPEAPSGGGNKKKGTKMTLAAKFKLDLDNLMTTLRATVPHFIRCVKPNADQVPTKFDAHLALNQLKYSGLFEAIRIRKAGYAVRMANDAFIKRYKHICLTIPGNIRQDPIAYCNALLSEMEKEVNYAELAVQASASSGKKIDEGDMRRTAQWIVGNTKVFIRTAAFKMQLEKIRDSKSSNCSVPLQKIVRGFIMRSRFVAKINQMRKASNERRIQEGKERELMAKEEVVSMAIEQVTRSDTALQAKLAAAKRDRLRIETEKRQAAEAKGATLMQKIVRGKLCRTRGRIYMCETMLEKALHKRDEKLINRAIIMPNIFGVTSKLIKQYVVSAKKLIMEVLNEAHVANELNEAMLVGSVPLLKDAIARAENAHMSYLKELRDAKRTLHQILHLRSILSSIEGVLVKCVSVPKLIAHSDELETLLEKATDLDLAGEYQVQDAASRLHRVRNLIQLRDRIRFAVEVCSPSKMHSTSLERAKLLRIYGPDLFLEEAQAVEGMFRMLNYQIGIDDSFLADEEDGEENVGDPEGKDADHSDEIKDSEAFPSTKKKSSSQSNASDICLPPFIRKGLEEMLLAHDQESLDAAKEGVLKLVPDENRLRSYQRVFKWVVAFATWRYRDIRSQLRDGSSSQNSVQSGSGQAGTLTPNARKQVGSNTGLNSSQSSVVSPSLKSSSKAKGSPTKSTISPSSAPFIPFAQRQARSQVAAHEILKKGKNIHHVDFRAKTDTLLRESIAEYDNFKKKLQPKSTFRG